MIRLLWMPVAFVRLIMQSVFLALGQIWANKARSVLTTIGIVIGVASITAVIAALTGLKTKVLEEIESFGTNNIYINAERPNSGPKKNSSHWSLRFYPEHFDDLLEHCPSIERFSRSSWGDRHTISYGERSIESIRVYGVEPEWYLVENRKIAMGRPFSIIDEEQRRQVCLIEPELRDKLGMDRDCIGDIIYVSGKAFRVVGLVERRPQSFLGGGGGGEDNFEIYIPFRTNCTLREKWVWATAQSKSADVAEEAIAELKFFLRRNRQIRPGEPDTFRVQSIQSELEKFNKIAGMITMVAGGIVGISLLVGGVGIMNIMLVSVSERTREIGLRKAVGAKNSAIMTQFLVEAVVLCCIGGLVGVGLGQLLTMAISQLNPMMDHTQIPSWAIAISFGFAGGVGLFFGMFPALKAARLDPIEALRHE